jgi:hypothetical protein
MLTSKGAVAVITLEDVSRRVEVLMKSVPTLERPVAVITLECMCGRVEVLIESVLSLGCLVASSITKPTLLTSRN